MHSKSRKKLKIAQEEFKLPPLLTDEEIEEIPPILPDITKWANDIAAYALESVVHHGKEWNGYKLVEGRSNRKYSDDDAVAKVAKSMGKRIFINRVCLTLPRCRSSWVRRTLKKSLVDY